MFEYIYNSYFTLYIKDFKTNMHNTSVEEDDDVSIELIVSLVLVFKSIFIDFFLVMN